MEIEKLWIVSFNPKTNQFDIESVFGTVIGNLDMLFNHRKDCVESDNWMVIFVSESIKECSRFIKDVKKQIKTGNTPVEDWYYEKFFNNRKN